IGCGVFLGLHLVSDEEAYSFDLRGGVQLSRGVSQRERHFSVDLVVFDYISGKMQDIVLLDRWLLDAYASVVA
ncbi:hypothetical protein, partial [Pseudomonas syringae group genomosp. 7]|uniref:hypothetical protein n=1 Tax=Pseudomonas syringae group genomosp. 7 TaxID=251699 RepID=UPI00376FD69B